MKPSRVVLFLAVSLLCALGASAADELLAFSNPVTPRVAYQLQREGNALRVTVEAGAFDPAGKDVAVELGVSADKTLRLAAKDAKVRAGKGLARFEFTVPAKSLVANADGWKKLRVALAVEWAGPAGQPARLQQAFLHTRPRAAHAGLSVNPADWQAVDLDEWERLAADRAMQIAIDYQQPVDGKATIVIDDASGKRVRNLIAAQPMQKGPQRIVWDGLDEQGNVALPGDYRWKAIAHPGLSPTHLFDFVNGPGSNHGTLHAAITNGASLFFASPVAEGGHEIIELTPDGTFKRGFNPPNGHGLKDVALAVDEKFLYVAHDGMAWGDKVDRAKPDWKGTNTLSIMRVDLEKWSIAEFPGNVRHAALKKYDFGPGSQGSRAEGTQALAGLALVGGRLFVGDAVDGQVLVIDPATAKVERTFPLPEPVALAAAGEWLYAVAGGKLQLLDRAAGNAGVLAKLEGRPAGLTVGPDGTFYVSDQQDHVVRVLDARAKPVAVIGKPGGIAPGPYDPLKFQNPNGLAIADGRLWVTEKGRWEPKRLSAYDVTTGQVAKEYFGPTNYGAQSAGFDDTDHTRWIGQGTLFKVDFTTGEAKPLSILGGESGRRHTFWRQDGRTFVITSGKATYLQELTPDGTLRQRALLSSAHQFAYSHEWLPPQAFIDAFTKAYPDLKMQPGVKGGIQRFQPNHGYGMLWVDRNGDSAMQAEEIEFATAATNLAGSGWSHDFHDLTIRVPAEVGGKKVLVTLKPDGWWPGGAPKYPALNDAAKAGVPIDLPGPMGIETAVDRFGNTIMNSTPDMTAFSPDGKRLWSYRNLWSGVHGSHDAPLPGVGQLQGALFFTGVVPLDDKSDVMLINGNHGQAFVMTSDGLYIDAMFPDVRLMTNPQAGGIGVLGGECFGGTFGRSEDGNYYFQGGGIAYRVYRVDGLRETKRSEGALKVSTAQSAAAERNQKRLVAEKSEARATTVPLVATAPVKDDDWKKLAPVAKWDRDGKFAVVVRAACDAATLYLHYTVRDDSPWVNQGKDWQALFKTGDGIDLQLGTDPAAKPNRGGPVPGDLRLFIAPSAQGDVAVLYRHRVPGAKEADGVVFQSPWRSEKVDVVRKLTTAKFAVQRSANEYRVAVTVPLSELGLANAAGQKLRGDFGVIYGDAEGTTNIYRNYWSNQATGLVNDVPGEIMLSPRLWGDVTFGAASKP
jgi:outer membrane protein assembly factor BamB